jgi:glucokinase
MPTRRTIGVEIGGTTLLAGAVDAGLGVHHRTQRAIGGLDQSALLDVAVDAVEEARNASRAEVAAVGFGIPSVSHQRSGGVRVSARTPLTSVRVADVMAERVGMPAFADTAANVVALAEHRAGAARGARDAIVLTIDAGINAGVILAGELQHGKTRRPLISGSGTELMDATFELAREQPSSRLARAIESGRQPTGSLVTELAHDGDRAALAVITRIGRQLGTAIAELVGAYHPQVVVVGGGVIAAGELLLAPARAELASHGAMPLGDEVPIVASRFGADAVIAGAAALAFDGLERRGSEAA